MKRIISNMKIRRQEGFVMPVVLLFLVVLSIVGLTLSLRFSGTGAKEVVHFESTNKKYGGAMAGIDRGRYQLMRPDSPGLAHVWIKDSPPTVYTFNIDGENVTVTVEDKTWEN